MSSLLIVESPAKCAKIQGYLGQGWRVIATMGHIRALEEDLDAVGLDRDFEPRFAFLKDKAKAIAQIKEAAAKADTVYLASDDDREGEAISYSVAALLKLDPATTPRAVYREITETAVKAAVAAPRRIDMNRVHAQQARAVLDMMVGFTISPLLWKYVGSGLSAGRCQTPALRLLADKEDAIRSFTQSTAWRIKGSWKEGETSFEANMIEDLEDRESAENYLENIRDDTLGTVKESVTAATTESPPRPLITSTLQQEASACMGIQPTATMKIAQRLYEAGHITYMRTDSDVLSEEAAAAARAWVTEAFGKEYVASVAAAALKKKMKAQATQASSTTGPPAAQEAHEAIRPTDFEARILPADEDWSAVDRKLYALIWNRATQSVMAAAKGEKHTVKFVAVGDPGEFIWQSIWKRELFAGWKKIGAAATDLDAEDVATEAAASSTAWTAATSLSEGDTVNWVKLEAAPHDARSPARFTEATLVRELERKGIGRPSTFASLVATLSTKNYMEKRDTPAQTVEFPTLTMTPGAWPLKETKTQKKVGGEKNKLVPTALGTSALEFCLREFEQLFAYEFTKKMETRLDGIATGAEQWKELCRDTWGTYKEKYAVLKEGKSTAAAGPARERLFEGGIKAVQSKKGPLLLKEGATKADGAVFYGWPEGRKFHEITEGQVAEFVAGKAVAGGGSLGTYEGTAIMKKSGPHGPYASCGSVSVPWAAGDTEETLQAKFKAKKENFLHRCGTFEFRNGPYGVYMFKTDQVGKARKFVGLPTGVDPKALTLEAATKIFQTGLKAKATAKTFGAKGKAQQ